MTYLAHTENDQGQPHLLRDHLRGVGELAEGFASTPHIAAWPLIQSFSEGHRKALDKYICFLREKGIHGEPIRVRLRARGVTARIFAERMFHPSQQTIERTARTGNSEETTTIEMAVASGRGLLRFILGWGAEVEVLAPIELRREVASALKEALERLESDTKKNPQGGLQE